MTNERLQPGPGEQLSSRNARMREAMEILVHGFNEIIESDGFQRYLETMSRFHKYSYGNVLLIMAQNPDATRVAGYRQWQRLGRQVKREAKKGMKIHGAAQTAHTRQQK